MMNIRARVSRPERRVDAVRVRARRALLFVVLTGIAPVQAQKIGSFSAGTSADAMTGKTTVYIETESTSEPETETEYRPRLVVVCSEDGKLRAMYSYGKNLSGPRKVVMRYDDDKPYTTQDDSVYYDPKQDNNAARSVSLPI